MGSICSNSRVRDQQKEEVKEEVTSEDGQKKTWEVEQIEVNLDEEEPVLDASDFSWGYTEENGPKMWKKYYPAARGKKQSPIDINTEGGNLEGVDKQLLNVNYQNCRATLVNNGHTLQWNVANAGGVNYDGIEYKLVQFHFHRPSEHTFDTRHTALEIHFVHSDQSSNLLVIGICFDIGGRDNTFIDIVKIEEHLAVEESQELTEEVDFSAIDWTGQYFHYDGSLTTPPCSEGVCWFVKEKIDEISQEQFDWFQQSIDHENNRPCQCVHDREVYKRKIVSENVI